MKYFWWFLSALVIVFLSYRVLDSTNPDTLSIVMALPIIWAVFAFYTFGVLFSKKDEPKVLQMAKPMKNKKKR